MYESHNQPPLSRDRFMRRLWRHIAFAAGLLLLSLLIGIAGYGYFEGLSWRDGFLNASMLLGGMGPVDPPRTDGGKLFAGLYALYSGLIFIFSAGVVSVPVLHRLLHKFHWEQDHG